MAAVGIFHIPREALRKWATSQSDIKAIYVFGSYARGEATADSDLDLASEFIGVDEEDAELICNAQIWKSELTRLTGITVKDLYAHDGAPVTRGPVIRAFP